MRLPDVPEAVAWVLGGLAFLAGAVLVVRAWRWS